MPVGSPGAQLTYCPSAALPSSPPFQKVVPASGPSVHFQTPSVAASLPPSQAPRSCPAISEARKAFSAAEVIVARWPPSAAAPARASS